MCKKNLQAYNVVHPNILYIHYSLVNKNQKEEVAYVYNRQIASKNQNLYYGLLNKYK